MSAPYERISKFLSLVLRHKPEQIGIVLDESGWVDVDTLVAACGKHKFQISVEELEHVVRTSEKKRFAFSQDKKKIRANQGHSVDVELGYQPVEPPEILYHGTAVKSLESIRATGLERRARTHVHLSTDIVTASKVGVRHGQLVLLEVLSKKMFDEGFLFYLSDNGVWLTERVPVAYIRFSSN
ncbi:MAG: RNA 2'-phosphotransferase [Candidatus Obscuribacterales bacterium]|nr:RNA 2'-phosphotransferase [Candidatus Obscuribacterales bacterium]